MTLDQLLQALEPKELPTIVLGLERVEALLAELGHPHRALPPVIHVAGTNGKGSTLAYLSAICEAAGLTYHRYLSPHLVRFNERILLQGREVSDEQLMAVLPRVLKATETVPATFFEATTAAAFCLFAEHPADVLLLETGMGGRLDATNVVPNPLAALITPIAMDHEAFLGNTLEAIAGEKAGIIKPGRPVLLAEQAPEAASILCRTAHDRGAPLQQAGRDWHYQPQAGGWRWWAKAGEGGAEQDFTLPLPALPGEHQLGNAALAIAAARLLPGVTLTETLLAEALRKVEHPARLQALPCLPDGSPLPEGVSLWLDGGHNPQAGAILAHFFRGQPSPRILIAAMMRDKDAAGFLRPLAPVIDRMIATAVPGEPRSFSPEALAALAATIGMNVEVAEDIRAASPLALRQVAAGGSILIGGSLYLAGNVLTHVAQLRHPHP